MAKSMLLATFFETYGLWIILIALFAILFLFNTYRQKKFNNMEQDLLAKLEKGVKVKTYAGIYAEVEKITDTTDGKVVTLKLSDSSFMDVDFHAIMGIDEKKTMEEVEMLEKLNSVSEIETAPIKTVEEEKPAVVEETEVKSAPKRTRKTTKSENE